MVEVGFVHSENFHDFHDFSPSFLNAGDSKDQGCVEREKEEDNHKSLNREKFVKVVKPVSGEDEVNELFPDPDEANPWN